MEMKKKSKKIPTDDFYLWEKAHINYRFSSIRKRKFILPQKTIPVLFGH